MSLGSQCNSNYFCDDSLGCYCPDPSQPSSSCAPSQRTCQQPRRQALVGDACSANVDNSDCAADGSPIYACSADGSADPHQLGTCQLCKGPYCKCSKDTDCSSNTCLRDLLATPVLPFTTCIDCPTSDSYGCPCATSADCMATEADRPGVASGTQLVCGTMTGMSGSRCGAPVCPPGMAQFAPVPGTTAACTPIDSITKTWGPEFSIKATGAQCTPLSGASCPLGAIEVGQQCCTQIQYSVAANASVK